MSTPELTSVEIVALLGGVTAVARLLNIKPPSVHKWLSAGIPEDRLRELAAHLEIKSQGRFTRRGRWPDNYAFYWPELANTSSPAPAAADTCLCASHGSSL